MPIADIGYSSRKCLAISRLARFAMRRACQQTWISREEGSGTSALAESVIGDFGVIPGSRLDLPSWEAIKVVMRLGYGIAAVSRLVVTDELKMGSLVVLPVFPTKIRRTFSIIRIRDAALTSAAQHFLAVLRDHCATRNLIRL